MTTTKKVSKTKGDHVGFRNGAAFCYHCGKSLTSIIFPAPVQIYTAALKAFGEMHEDCEPVWKEPVPDMSQTQDQRQAWWLKDGEQGESSKAMFTFFTSGSSFKKNCPQDPDDFKRCYKLLNAIPEFKPRLPELKALSPQWSNLVDNWDKLTELYEDMKLNKKANGMYELMETLIK